MLMLTATSETQGQRPGDFCDTVEGELVVIFADCHVSAHTDRLMRCQEGCPSRFFGLNSHQMSTTAKVRPSGISWADYVEAITGYMEARGARAPQSAACLLAELTIERAAELPGTVAGLADGRQYVRSTPQRSVRGALAVAAHLAQVPVWRHRSGKRLRELEREEGGQGDGQPGRTTK